MPPATSLHWIQESSLAVEHTFLPCPSSLKLWFPWKIQADIYLYSHHSLPQVSLQERFKDVSSALSLTHQHPVHAGEKSTLGVSIISPGGWGGEVYPSLLDVAAFLTGTLIFKALEALPLHKLLGQWSGGNSSCLMSSRKRDS